HVKITGAGRFNAQPHALAYDERGVCRNSFWRPGFDSGIVLIVLEDSDLFVVGHSRRAQPPEGDAEHGIAGYLLRGTLRSYDAVPVFGRCCFAYGWCGFGFEIVGIP